jgi:hypothetical protein
MITPIKGTYEDKRNLLRRLFIRNRYLWLKVKGTEHGR